MKNEQEAFVKHSKMSRKFVGTLVIVALVFMLSISSVIALALGGAFSKTESTQPDKWYTGSDLTIDEHFIFGEDRMYTEGKANRGFNNLIDNNASTVFYVTTNDTGVNYQDLTGKEISVTFHTNSPVVINHFKIISGGDTYKANYAHRSPTAWNLKAGNSLDSCDNVLLENLPVKATTAYEENLYEIENTTPYKYYKFTITALAGAGRSGHDSQFSNPTATCLLTDIAIGGLEEGAHIPYDGITFEKWNSTNSLPNTAGSYYLTDDVTVGNTWSVPSGTVNLCLNGHAITKTGNSGSAFYAGSGSTLNLYDCDTTTHYYDINSSTYLAENINTTSGTYSFVGGYITGGMGYAYNGGRRGGGIYVQGGTVNIHGGAFVGNKASSGEGGGILIEYGTVTMSGGHITGNQCFGGRPQAVRTDAVTTNMNHDAEKFTNTNPNFTTVTFNVTDGFIEVKPINVTVTIKGHNDTVDYDGKEHTVTGYDATASTDLYDVNNDFTFSGKDEAKRTDAGKTNMGLSSSRFRNTNDNFNTVKFNVTDGYMTVVSVDAVLTKAPQATDPIYNGEKQELIVAGQADGGTLYYALGSDVQNAPSGSSFSTTIPSATASGNYYVWYKVVGDANHNDLSPVRLKVIMAESDWVTLTGTLYQTDGKTPLSDTLVTLTHGNKTVDYVTTDEQGGYKFVVPAGVYNIVTEYNNSTQTTLVTAFTDVKQDLVISDGKTESQLKVNSDTGIAVGGLEEEERAVRKADNVADDKKVSVIMTVESRTEANASNAALIVSAAPDKSLEFFDIKVEKTLDSVTTVMNSTNNVMEIRKE